MLPGNMYINTLLNQIIKQPGSLSNFLCKTHMKSFGICIYQLLIDKGASLAAVISNGFMFFSVSIPANLTV